MTTFLFFKQRKVINTLTEEHVVKGASVFVFYFISPNVNIVVTLPTKYFSSKQQMSELLISCLLPVEGRRWTRFLATQNIKPFEQVRPHTLAAVSWCKLVKHTEKNESCYSVVERLKFYTLSSFMSKILIIQILAALDLSLLYSSMIYCWFWLFILAF